MHSTRPIALWSLREDVLLETAASGVVLLTRWGEIRVDRPDPLVLETLRRMSFGPVNLDNVVPPDGDEAVRRRLAGLLDRLRYVVIRSIGLADSGRPLLSVVPITPDAEFRPASVPAEGRLRLSRMATMRIQDGGLMVESPLAAHRVVVHHPLIGGVLAALAAPATPTVVAAQARVPYDVVAEVVSHLVGAGMAVAEDPATARFAEDTDPALRFWSPHELLFHARGRAGRGDGPPAPDGEEAVVKGPPPGPRIELYRPALPDLLAHDPPMTAVLEGRRSYHRFGADPVTAEQVGELLYRAARLRALRPAGPGRPEGSDRPYPSAGELELYVIVDDGQGLPRAVYHYDPYGHALTQVNATAADVSDLLEACRVAGRLDRRPPVLMAITARFRLAGTHPGGGYAGTLRHAGVLQQSLCLVATAMGLAPCTVIAHDDERRARALRLDWRVESTVGDFVVGTRPDQLRENANLVAVNDPDWARRGQEVIDSQLR